jgi:AAA+ superfamily predicted ATPase
VDRRDYARLYRIARQRRRESEAPAEEPVLPPEQRDALWKNTIGYLDRSNLRRIKDHGGRPKRGILLTGPPGNGKTSACRWLWDECKRRNWEWRLVSPDAYAMARRSHNAEAMVRAMFTVAQRGIIFFDDMDLALRDRDTVRETDDQAVFLGALDGIEVTEGVVFVFTTNCSLGLIDRAFKRPGRIDVVLNFGPPDADLRRRLMDRWHPDIRAALDVDRAVASTDGFSYAEIEEVKNLLIMHFTDADRWDWEWALQQLEFNRHELGAPRPSLGFAAPANGPRPKGRTPVGAPANTGGTTADTALG